ncbi:MAG: hypothetical protein RQ733_14240, partial [Methyloprofundus sp.]|nr:hypothetical protein [Methyloprofundus sp.]
MTTADQANLMAQAIDGEFDEDGSFAVEDDNEVGLCLRCKEWASVVRYYNADCEEVDTVSNCCTSG